jgi:hypothetical protein
VSLPDDPSLERPDDPKDTAKLKAVLVLVATIAFVLSPFLAPSFSGFDPGQFPVPVDDPPIQPAGWAFSIWGVIYVWLLASAGFGLVRRDTDARWDRTRWPLLLSVGVGASWLGVAATAPVMATILIWVMLGGALLALRAAPVADRAWLSLPLGLYAGWLTAASCVALANVAAGYGLGDVVVLSWTGLALALVIAIGVTLKERVPTYPLAVGWALAGVVAANFAASPAFAGAALGGVLGMAWLTFRSLPARA